jgi:AraC-like DNA-binding protein
MASMVLIRASTMRPCFRHLDALDAKGSALLERARIALRDPDALFPFALGGRLWSEAASATGDPALGLHLGQGSHVEDMGALGAVARRSATLGAALDKAARFSPRFNSGQRFWLERAGNRVAFHRRYDPSLFPDGAHDAHDFVTVTIVRLIEQAGGPGWRPDAIAFQGSRPRHAEELAALAKEEVRFDADSTAITFSRTLLAQPLPPAPSGTAGGESFTESSFEDSLRTTVALLLRLGMPRVALAAESAGMSIRSFQRRLAEAGLAFGDLVDAARFEVARDLLCDPTVRIIDVSNELGYTDSANFTRAFRRWTGLPPREFRRLAFEPAGAPA